MTTLTYTRLQPESSDQSEGTNGWMVALAANAALDDAHSHDGTTSARLTSASIDAATTTTGTGWGSPDANGTYSMNINMPTGRDFNVYDIAFKTAAGQKVYLDYVKVSASVFTVSTNDNTANYTVLFLS